MNDRDFYSIYNKTYSEMLQRHNEPTAQAIALEVAKQAMLNPPTVVEAAPLVTAVEQPFDIVNTPIRSMNADGLVIHAEGDDLIIEGVLDDTMLNKQGKRWSEKALQHFADQINKHGIKGDFASDEYHDQVKQLYKEFSNLSTDRFIKAVRDSRNGIVKIVKAAYENGRLWIRGVVDKRYKNHLERFSNMSLEAYVPHEWRNGDVYEDGHILGLQLVDDNGAVNPRSFVKPVIV